MDEEAAKPRESTVNQQHQYHYGTFQGVANYPSPAPPPQLLPPLQQPQHPIATFPGHAYQNLQGFKISHSLILDNLQYDFVVLCLVCDCFVFAIVRSWWWFCELCSRFPSCSW